MQFKHPSLEAIDPQHPSDFAQGLADIFREARKKYQEFSKSKDDPMESTREHFKSKLTPKFKQLISDHTGISISKIYYTDRPLFVIAMIPNIGNAESTVDIKSRISGQGSATESDMTPSSIQQKDILTFDEFKSVSESLDKQSGKVDPSMAKKYDISAQLLMDLPVMVALEEEVSPKADNLTPEEAAAIWLHELGHQMSLVEHAADSYQIYNTKVALMKSFFRAASPNEKIKALKHFIDEGDPSFKQDEKMDKMFSCGEKLVSKFSTIAGNPDREEMKRLSAQKGQNPNAFGKDVLNRAGGILLVLSQFMAISFLTVTNLFKHAFGNIAGMSKVPELGWTTKVSDLAATSKSGTIEDRYADEYVSMHGMASHLASAMDKITEAMAVEHVPEPVDIQEANQSRAYAETIYTLSMVVIANMREDDRFQEHEAMYNRLRSCQQDAIRVLKQSNSLPAEVKHHYVREYNELQKLMDNLQKKRSKSSVKFVNNLYKVVDTLLDGYSLVDIVLDAGFRKKYTELSDAVKNIESNPLFHRAAQLEITEED